MLGSIVLLLHNARLYSSQQFVSGLLPLDSSSDLDPCLLQMYLLRLLLPTHSLPNIRLSCNRELKEPPPSKLSILSGRSFMFFNTFVNYQVAMNIFPRITESWE